MWRIRRTGIVYAHEEDGRRRKREDGRGKTEDGREAGSGKPEAGSER
jgi:hypothetical protein